MLTQKAKAAQWAIYHMAKSIFISCNLRGEIPRGEETLIFPAWVANLNTHIASSDLLFESSQMTNLLFKQFAGWMSKASTPINFCRCWKMFEAPIIGQSPVVDTWLKWSFPLPMKFPCGNHHLQKKNIAGWGHVLKFFHSNERMKRMLRRWLANVKSKNLLSNLIVSTDRSSQWHSRCLRFLERLFLDLLVKFLLRK